jgi:hypothetical protein
MYAQIVDLSPDWLSDARASAYRWEVCRIGHSLQGVSRISKKMPSSGNYLQDLPLFGEILTASGWSLQNSKLMGDIWASSDSTLQDFLLNGDIFTVLGYTLQDLARIGLFITRSLITCTHTAISYRSVKTCILIANQAVLGKDEHYVLRRPQQLSVTEILSERENLPARGSIYVELEMIQEMSRLYCGHHPDVRYRGIWGLDTPHPWPRKAST